MNCINYLTKETVKTGDYGDCGVIQTVEEQNCDLVLLLQEHCCVIDDLICFEILWRLQNCYTVETVETEGTEETDETVETVETIETVDTAETVQTVETAETVETVKVVETVGMVETVETVEPNRLKT